MNDDAMEDYSHYITKSKVAAGEGYNSTITYGDVEDGYKSNVICERLQKGHGYEP